MEQKINEIMHVMNSIEYGFRDENNKNIIYDEEKWRNEFNDFYYLQTPKELLKSKCGICWDQVELERELFKNTKFKYETYFIYLNDNNMPLIENDKLNMVFGKQPGVLKKKYGIDIKEQMLKYDFSKFSFDEDTKKGGSKNAVR